MAPRGAKTWFEISQSALRANAETLRRLIGKKTALMGVVKANAYGHGLTETVRILNRSEIDWYGVDSPAEARAVRAAGTGKPTLILGYTPLADLKEVLRLGASLTVYTPETAAELGRVATKKYPARVHLKIETGTARQGVFPQDLPRLLRLIKKFSNVSVEGISTHLADIEDTDDPSFAFAQVRRLGTALETASSLGMRPRYVHAAASAALMLYADTRFTMVRSGISLYGLWPAESTRRSMPRERPRVNLSPALSWKTIVAQIKHLPAGAPIGYGLTERVARDSKIAVLPVGYADGLDRKLSSIGQALIRGRRAKILGRICMNMCMVDVTDIPDTRPEDEAVLIGRQGRDGIFAENLAEQSGTINYETISRLNPALPRIIRP